MKVEASQYGDAVSWIRDLVTGCVFSQDRWVDLMRFEPTMLTFRLSVIIAKMLQELPFEKRQGSSIARAWANKLTYDVGKATSEACALLHSLEFIPAVAEALEKDPESVITKMNEMRQHCESICINSTIR
jgi:Zn-dependent M16 (insulinase) family peptidase